MKYRQHDRTLIKPYEVDFVIPEIKLGIEINDIGSHYFPLKPRDYHLKKYLAVREQGYNLWTIWQWQLCYKRSILDSMLRTKLKLPMERIFARKCAIRECSSKEARAWYDATHIQGFCPATTHTALEYEGQIVAMMSWSIREEVAELVRFSSQRYTLVIGGFSKLFSASRPDVKQLITFSFNDYSDGEVYAKNGWKYVGDVAPRYWWVHKTGKEVLSRRACQKKKLVSKFRLSDDEANSTEFEIMSKRHYVQVFDCGKRKWVYEKDL